MSGYSIEELAKIIEAGFQPENAAGINAGVQLEILEEPVEYWLMTIQNKRCKIEKGRLENPRVSVSIDHDDLLALISGKLDPMRAFFSGRVHVHGDRGFLMKLPGLFSIETNQLIKK